ncbi:tRNA 2-selenouridine(34) synthase MnmH [Desulfuromonas sp. AOP6]|uniref:tRNA 2-selenouridine(34) synthase MnmH n=1 Tax=Desulfuromonas sp. AOP6 TaxID=1566351 RepID=UPI00126E8CE0|nr:tRNA 2-selenouridine(34) synthase MnmH [Desulfuromonas sp. AOP6]BCA80707.1 tRNA 2-selenouridine synthase [Desulfuromonas sp. AOP6]
MHHLKIDLQKALLQRDEGALFIDCRTPSEFAETTIPGAVNIPLFDDEQRARVGLLYKEEGPGPARRLAVDLVSPRIPAMIRQVDEVLDNRRRPVVVFCWRGGMRSRALTAFLDLAGFSARQLTGGHKAFRAEVREFLEKGEWGRLLVLRGLTGVGKTRILHRLRGEGYPVLDLEGLANHRGSAFGALGLGEQPSQKTFEARLWDALRKIPQDGYALAEGESKNIGKVVLPPRVYEALQQETSLWLKASLDYRTQLILQEYPVDSIPREDFVAPIVALKRRLGAETVDRLLALLHAGKWGELVTDLMSLYYDPLYFHTHPDRRIEIHLEPEEEGIIRLKESIRRLLAEPSVHGLRKA